MPEPSAPNLDRLANTLTDLGAEHPIDDTLTGSSLARPVSFKVTTRHGDVQVLSRMPAIPPYAGLRAAADQGKVEGDDGTIATVCSLADLREMKIASGRPRDLVDIAELHELHGRP